MSWHRRKQKENKDHELYPTVVDGIKKIYGQKLRPLEQLYMFDKFHSPLLKDSDFDAKPMVLLLGQYSTGKTTFIRYLLESEFPGSHIGPEPTTDRFVAIMHGPHELVTPGNALAVQADKPFRALSKFGNDFLNRFQGSQMPCPVLEDLTFVDSPGVLSGEKQRIGRQYDFTSVVEWFAERSDMILLLFDAHKLDISDEFKRTIEALKGQEEKIRVVLNKADMVSNQALMRIYGALMWSLGKVRQTPEVPRVYISSFWEKPYNNDENAKLFDAEKEDLFKDLYSLPRMSAVRKINELVKRARLAKTHAYVISYLKTEMPSVFGKSKKQDQLIADLKSVFFDIHKKYGCPVGDFPPVARMQEMLKTYDFQKFPKLQPKLIKSMDDVLGRDIPQLMKQFPQEQEGLNPYETTNPFEADLTEEISSDGLLSETERLKYGQIFRGLNPVDGLVSGGKVRGVLIETGLPKDVLSQIWSLCDRDKDGYLNAEEFVAIMWLANRASSGNDIPDILPVEILAPLPSAPY